MGGGPTTHTTTQETTLPDWYTKAMQTGADAAGRILKPGFENAGPVADPIADLNSDHSTYAGLMRSLGRSVPGSRADAAVTAGRGGYGAMPFAASAGYTSTDSPAALVTGDHIKAMANPFTDMVSKAVNDRINKQNDRAASQIGSRAASRGAFAGSGSQEALERALLSEDTMDQATESEANLRSAAYDRATDAAFRNSDIVRDSLTRSQNVAVSNTNNFNDSLTRATQTMLSAAGLDLEGIRSADGMDSSYIDRAMQVAGGMKGVGDTYQQQQQRETDAPLTQLERYLAVLNGGQLPQTTTSTQPVYDNNGGLWGTLAMLAGAVL